MFEIICCWW